MLTSNTEYGLRQKCLSFSETLSQSVANISPTLTPVVIVPLVFASAGNGTWLAYLFATIGLMLVGLNINQFAKRSASPGSLYSYITRGMGMSAGFLSGWCLIVAYLFTGMAVLAGSVNYAIILLGMMHITVHPVFLFGAGAALAWYIAYKDIKLSTQLMLVLEAISMAIILVLGVIIMAHKGVAIDTTQFRLEGMNFSGLKAGLILAIFSYVGYESATTLGEEARNPLKAIPKAVLMSALISGLFFMLTSYIAVLGFHGMKGSLGDSTAPFNDLADSAGVGFFAVLISIGAVISMFACTLASINAGSRILFSMGRHGVFHSHIGKAHSENSTPHHAATAASIIVFLLPAIMIFSGQGVLDVFNDLSTIATYGFPGRLYHDLSRRSDLPEAYRQADPREHRAFGGVGGLHDPAHYRHSLSGAGGSDDLLPVLFPGLPGGGLRLVHVPAHALAAGAGRDQVRLGDDQYPLRRSGPAHWDLIWATAEGCGCGRIPLSWPGREAECDGVDRFSCAGVNCPLGQLSDRASRPAELKGILESRRPSGHELAAKLNLISLGVFALGLGASALVSQRFFTGIAHEHVVQNARIMMETAMAMRMITDQITPVLNDRSSALTGTGAAVLYPQTVPAFAATESFNYLRKQYPDYSYKEATLNPTNPRDRPSDWEADIIARFRNDNTVTEVVGQRDAASEESIDLAPPHPRLQGELPGMPQHPG